jgi:NAD(P)-dependent dehydrogenase (short-subunit alcohol dehydrogenase family)
MSRLAGKRAAVVGAGSVGPGLGIGKATALRFAQAGARVLCIDRDATAAAETAALIADAGGTARALALDVTDPDAGRALQAAAETAWGGLDILHYNVGISSLGGLIDSADADWERVFDVNLMAAVRLTRATLPAMRAQGAGAYSYVSSLVAVMSGPYSYPSYEASKAALGRFARSVARENAPHGIRANVILPGVIDTPHVRHFIDAETPPEALDRKRAALVPMGRQGTAWDVADAALYLASDEAAFVSGIELRVDGAMSA